MFAALILQLVPPVAPVVADSVAIAAALGHAIDTMFTGMDPTLRGLLLGGAVSVVFHQWKKVVDPATPWLPSFSVWWEANRDWLNPVAPALAAWLVSGHSVSLSGLIATLMGASGDGLRRAVGSLLTAVGTRAGIKRASAAAALLVACAFAITVPAHAQVAAPGFNLREHVHPTLSAGLADRWGQLRRDDNAHPIPYLVLQPGINWNDKLAFRARLEHSLNRDNLWAAEFGVFYVIR